MRMELPLAENAMRRRCTLIDGSANSLKTLEQLRQGGCDLRPQSACGFQFEFNAVGIGGSANAEFEALQPQPEIDQECLDIANDRLVFGTEFVNFLPLPHELIEAGRQA